MSLANDYQDFLRVDQAVGTPLQQGVIVGAVNPTTIGPFFVGPWPAVLFYLFQVSGAPIGYTVDVVFYTDSTLATVISTYTWKASAGITIIDTAVCQGPWMALTLHPVAAPRNFLAVISPRRFFASPAIAGGGIPFAERITLTIGAGATVDTVLNPVTACGAVWGLTANATSWSSFLLATDETGALTSVLARMDGSAAWPAAPQLVALPSRPVIWRLTNNDAASKVFSGAIVPLRQ